MTTLIKLALQCLIALERLVTLFKNQRNKMAKENLHQNTIDAVRVAKEKKDTSKIEEIFNSDKTTQ